MISKTPHSESKGASSDESLEHLIEHAAHLLPAQGPITAFVHHNTLHAFEDIGFEAGVRKGAKLFGCHPYLPEKRYREMLTNGRIRPQDIESVLHDVLGDRSDDLLGFLGTRFSLYRAILNYSLHDGPSEDVRWIVGDTNALNRFRSDADMTVRGKYLSRTKRWVMQDLRPVIDGISERQPPEWLTSELKAHLLKLFEMFDGNRIERWKDETWESFTLHLLWQISEYGVDQIQFETPIPNFVRHRDWVDSISGEDADELVHETLIQFCAAFIDQGLGRWPLEHRDAGFYQSFLKIFGQRFWLQAPWKNGLDKELRKLSEENIGPFESIRQSAAEFGIDAESLPEFIEASLLSLRGFAGMIWQLETRGDRVKHGMPKGTIIEFLAVRLILDRFAARHCVKQISEFSGSLIEFPAWAKQRMAGNNHELKGLRQRYAFRVFELAQLLGWSPNVLCQLATREWKMLVDELNAFSGIERRSVFHLAFERAFRNQALDAILAHSKHLQLTNSTSRKAATNIDSRPASRFQLLCCIDDREESFRRHLEEIVPECETYGTAGFFAVPMYYRGAADAHYSPLCPAVVVPKHYVREEVAFSLRKSANQRYRMRRTIGTVTQQVHIGSRTLTGGWIGTTILGSFATFPLVFRVLFPRLTSRVKSLIGGFVKPPEVTYLHLERDAKENPGPDKNQLGLTPSEMATAVERLLRDIGVTDGFARLFFVCGHGSSSLNNPHEAAYNCGACAGGRGGPNARAFAQMANDPRVRKLVADNGITIPETTVFVGAYHNTCDDSLTSYDLDDIPISHQTEYVAAIELIDEARKRDAHERCRRFESAPMNLSFDDALKHVEGRAEDLSQARPEYNHATNALCFVGQREWSRGLFLDRRCFLQSYDPSKDDERSTILERILQAVIPVCAGISLEYYFSCVDHVGYGAGNKLPHNITSLIGVMDGAASDLRPGLYYQMIEIHEPMRLLFVVQTTAKSMKRIIADNEAIRLLCEGKWVQLAIRVPGTDSLLLYKGGDFEPYIPETTELATASSSVEWYRGWRDHLKFASVES